MHTMWLNLLTQICEGLPSFQPLRGFSKERFSLEKNVANHSLKNMWYSPKTHRWLKSTWKDAF